MYTYGWFMLRFDRKQHSIMRLSLKKIKKKSKVLELKKIESGGSMRLLNEKQKYVKERLS